MKKSTLFVITILLVLSLTFGLVACGGGKEPESTQADEPTLSETLGLDLRLSELDMFMQPIFSGTYSYNETVMFLDKGDAKTLLYPIDTVVEVTSYDGSIIYEEGKDYVVEDGKLKITENSSIPCITGEKFYNAPGSILETEYEGKNVPTHWGEGRAMVDWQVNVSYTHTSEWQGYVQISQLEIYQDFVKKLIAGEDVTVFFYGDSITTGGNSSWRDGYAPYQDPYTILFVKALADLFDYTVHFEAANLQAPSGRLTTIVPDEDYVAGERGRITYVNTAIGGWTSEDGVVNVEKFVNQKIEQYGCDLFVLAFGMNDQDVSPDITAENATAILNEVYVLEPAASVVIISTMSPNPNATNGWYGNQVYQEPKLLELAQAYRDLGWRCGVACMTSISQAVLEHKEFHDYSGNNINHPNDYFGRIYAQALLQTVIGYENIK